MFDFNSANIFLILVLYALHWQFPNKWLRNKAIHSSIKWIFNSHFSRTTLKCLLKLHYNWLSFPRTVIKINDKIILKLLEKLFSIKFNTDRFNIAIRESTWVPTNIGHIIIISSLKNIFTDITSHIGRWGNKLILKFIIAFVNIGVRFTLSFS